MLRLQRCFPLLVKPGRLTWRQTTATIDVDVLRRASRYDGPITALMKLRDPEGISRKTGRTVLEGVKKGNPGGEVAPEKADDGDDVFGNGNGDKGKVSLFGKMRILFRDYGYVIVPVHLALSATWFTLMYSAIKSGIDFSHVVAVFGSSEKLARLGPFAATVVCMKLLSPIRYVITIAVTTVTIKVLKRRGVIKSTGELKEHIKGQYAETKENLKDRFKKDGK